MKIRLNIKEAVLDNSILCGNTPTLLDLTNLNVEAKLDGAILLISTDISNEPPFSLVVASGKTFYFDGVVNDNIVFRIDYPDDCQAQGSFNILNSSDFGISLTKTGYISYTNTFKLYNYDYGNDALSNYDNTIIPITNNTDFTVYLIDESLSVVNNVETLALSNFITYRKPYTDTIHVYNAVGTNLPIKYIDNASNVIINDRDGTVLHTNGYDITQVVTVDSLNYCTMTKNVAALQWFPKYSVAIYNNGCPDDCLSIFAENTADTTIDMSGVAVLPTNDILEYSSRYLTLNYKLFDNNGDLVDAAIYSITESYGNLDNSANTFTFSPLTLGDYVLQVKLSEYGVNGTVIDSVDLDPYVWYRIKTAQDFSSNGAVDSLVGEVFNTKDNSTVVNWTNGALWEMNAYNTCSKLFNLTGCNWATALKDTCPTYKFTNYKVTPIDLVLSQLQDDKTFLLLKTVTIAGSDSFTIDLAAGVYSVEFIATDIDIPQITTILIVDCSIIECYSKLYRTIMCGEKAECCSACGNSITNKEIDTMNLVVLIASFYTMIEEYKPNKLVVFNNSTILTDIYTISDTLNKIKEYCVDCVACTACKSI